MERAVKIISVVGARPQFVKLAPVAQAFDAYDCADHGVVHTGQHYDENMSGAFFDELELPHPELNLKIGSGTQAEQTGQMMIGLESVFVGNRPDVVIVYGDTNSTLAATLVATKLHIPIAHVESGLRSFNRTMPEEVNRLVADHCGDRLYAPTPRALQNLKNEGLGERAILSGDVMFDAVLRSIELGREKCKVIDKLGLTSGNFGLVTVHRPVNTSAEELRILLSAVEKVVADGMKLVFPVHPRTRVVLDEIKYKPVTGLVLIDPLPYLDNIQMVQAAACLITDSGGMQKEAAFLETPCVTVRKETEWTETVELGVNRLVDNDEVALREAVGHMVSANNLFDDETRSRLKAQYGEGNAANVIVKDIMEQLVD